jgi:hypothetical protein
VRPGREARMVHRRQGWAQEQRETRELAAGSSARRIPGRMGGLSCGLQETRPMMRELSLLQMAPGTDSAPLPQHADHTARSTRSSSQSISNWAKVGVLGFPSTRRSHPSGRSRGATGRGEARRGEPGREHRGVDVVGGPVRRVTRTLNQPTPAVDTHCIDPRRERHAQDQVAGTVHLVRSRDRWLLPARDEPPWSVLPRVWHPPRAGRMGVSEVRT